MRIINLGQFPDYKPDIVFKERSTPKLIATLVMAVVCIVLSAPTPVPIIRTKLPSWWCYVTGGISGLLALGLFAGYRKSLLPTNWLLRSSGTKLWVKFRDFRNAHLPTDEPQVIELERKDVAWVRPVTVKTLRLSPTGAPSGGPITTHETIKYLDIGVAHGDTNALDAHLRLEEHHTGAGKFGVRSKSCNYPVSVPEDGVIRLIWSDRFGRITPGLQAAADFFAHWTTPQAAQKQTVDYRPDALAALPETEQRRRLRELNRIDSFCASYAVQELRKCSSADAKQFLKEL